MLLFLLSKIITIKISLTNFNNNFKIITIINKINFNFAYNKTKIIKSIKKIKFNVIKNSKLRLTLR